MSFLILHKAYKVFLWIACAAFLFSCGDSAGEACQIAGSGFHASDPCRHKCLSRWKITCPDGQRVQPNQCTGTFDCAPGSCPSGQVCYHDNDPFEDRSFCVADRICGPADTETLKRWEMQTKARQVQVRLEREEKRRLRSELKSVSASAADVEISSESRPEMKDEPKLHCSDIDGRQSFHVSNQTLLSGQSWQTEFGNRWVFELDPVAHGWHVRVLDRPGSRNAVDLAAVTPPLHGMNNPRFLLGWHFRSLDNLGPNKGEVNAPQHLRLFEFEPELSGTGGLREAVGSGSGRGWLRVEALELTPPRVGDRASIESVSFSACLTWPDVGQYIQDRWADAVRASREVGWQNELTYEPADAQYFSACGIDTAEFELNALVLPRLLTIDLNGDGKEDRVAQVVRRSDRQRGLVFCLGGAEGHWVGDDIAVSAMEAWRAADQKEGPFGYVDEPPWPQMSGDALLVERLEKSLLAIYWHGQRLKRHTIYRMVEP